MNSRIVTIAFFVGLAGGCSFSSKFEDYCRNSGKCSCTGGQCCVVAGEECDAALGCCGGLTCGSDNKCSAPTGGGGGVTGGGGGVTGGGGGVTGGGGGVTGGGGGVTGGGGGVTGGGGGATGGGGGVTGGGAFLLSATDGGMWVEAGLSLRLPMGGVAPTTCADGGGLQPTWIHADGGVTYLACCQPGDAGTCAVQTTLTCTLPGYRSTTALPCCFCDIDCKELPETMICPTLEETPIDVRVNPVQVSQLPAEMRCTDGGLRVLEGCCSPQANFEYCNFGAGSCSLRSNISSVCCFVAWVGSPHASGPILLNDCRANGSCECNDAGRCDPTTGAVCVDVQGP